VIEQYSGDAIVAIFGVPIARRDDEEISQDAINAVRCRLATLCRLDERFVAEKVGQVSLKGEKKKEYTVYHIVADVTEKSENCKQVNSE
jgi:class 3 adenylate cyclase